MGRYNQNKIKWSGRYNPSNDKGAGGIPVLVVLILVLLAAAGGFFARPLIDGMKNETSQKVQALAIPFNSQHADTVEPVNASNTPNTANDNLETLPPLAAAPVLPELDSSDTLARETIIQVTPELASWLDTGQLIRTYMVIANDFSQGIRIAKHMQHLKMDQTFTAEQIGADWVMSAKSYRRYDRLAQAINAIDTPGILVAYKKLRPLLLQVFSEFSYPAEFGLEDMITRAAAVVLAAPVIYQPITLTKSSSGYKFSDPQLEALNPVHKQMMRMGAENTTIIQTKIRSLVEEMVNLGD